MAMAPTLLSMRYGLSASRDMRSRYDLIVYCCYYFSLQQGDLSQNAISKMAPLSSYTLGLVKPDKSIVALNGQ
jgi:hypothetical protein